MPDGRVILRGGAREEAIRSLGVVLALLLAMLTVAPSVSTRTAHASATPTKFCIGTAPRATVRQYYLAVERHQAAEAVSCLTPTFAKRAARFVDPDWVNVATVQSLQLHVNSIAPNSLPGRPPKTKPYAAAQVVAEFIVRYYRVIDASNGETIRFIYLVKQHRTSAWRIAAIGSGP